MAVEWGYQLHTGIPALDSEHEDVIETINCFFTKCDEGLEETELLKLFDNLDNYTKKHFSYEEKLQEINKYPRLAEQQEQHAQFLDDLAEMRKTLEEAGSSFKLTLTAKGRLIRWLNNHINTLDKDFIEFLNARKSR